MTLTAYVDFETRSELNVKYYGAHNYATHPSTEPLCLGWAVMDGPVQVYPFISPGDSELFREKPPPFVSNDLEPLFSAIKEGALVVAHNSGFDRSIWEERAVKRYGFPKVPRENWRCSSAAASHFGAPASLADAGKLLKTTSRKLESSAVKQLSKPLESWTLHGNGKKWNDDSHLFNELYTYNAADVEACRDVWRRCPEQSPFELRVWQIDQDINDRGAPVDVPLVRECAKLHKESMDSADTAIREATKGIVKSARARSLLGWVRNKGLVIENLQAETIRDTLKRDDLDPVVRLVLTLRVRGSGAASSKYPAILKAVSADGRARGLFVYCGANRTGRWSGKRVQPQNLIRPPAQFGKGDGAKLIRLLADEVSRGDMTLARCFGTDREILAGLLRPAFCAPEGRVFIALDFGQVEARITAWLAREMRLLEDFANGVDVYTNMAKRIDPRNPIRQLGKCATLGLIFGMWIDTFEQTVKSWGIEGVSRETIAQAVYVFRDTFPRIVELWADMGQAAVKAIRNPGTSCIVSFVSWQFDEKTKILSVRLPSGRHLYYHRATAAYDGISYWAKSGSNETGKIAQIFAKGSKLTENVVQAVAADLLREALVGVTEGIPQVPIVLHAHDEIVIESTIEQKEQNYEKFLRIMMTPTKWSGDLPIAADGWVGKRYRK